MVALLLAGCSESAASSLILGTTTTTQDSGLLDVLVPAFQNETKIATRPVVGGSGEIIAKAQHGDVDVLLTHSPAAERAFVAAGDGVSRTPVMYNRFFLVGPLADPANASLAANGSDAFRRVKESGSAFASRADGSGTDAKEKAIWKAAGYDASTFDRAWYSETGSGQSQTLLFADQHGAYALSDEATWAKMRANGQLAHLHVAFSNDSIFRNQYAVTLIDARKHPEVRLDEARIFAAWILGPHGQDTIASYRIAGQQVFFPNAGDPSP